MYRRRRAGPRYPPRGLHRAVRPPRRPARLHPPRWAHSTRRKGWKELVVLARERARVLRYLKEAKVPLNEFVFPRTASRTCRRRYAFPALIITHVLNSNVTQLENLLSKNYNLYRSATAGVPRVSAVVRVVLAEEDFRRECARLDEDREGIWVQGATRA